MASLGQPIQPTIYKGRGATYDPHNRFAPTQSIADDDGWWREETSKQYVTNRSLPQGAVPYCSRSPWYPRPHWYSPARRAAGGVPWRIPVVIVSAIGVYLAFLVLVRLFGARVLTAWSTFDAVVIIMFGAVAGRAVRAPADARRRADRPGHADDHGGGVRAGPETAAAAWRWPRRRRSSWHTGR